MERAVEVENAELRKSRGAPRRVARVASVILWKVVIALEFRTHSLNVKTSYDKNPSDQFLKNLQTGGATLDPLNAGNPRSGSVTE